MAAPLTGTPALAAHAEARTFRHHEGVAGWTYRTLASEQVVQPFEVDDGTGRVRVEPPAAGRIDLDLATVAGAAFGGQRGRYAVFWAPGGLPHADRLRAFHRRADDLDDDPFREFGPVTLGTAPRYLEGTVEPGDEVSVGGTVVDADADHGEPRFVVTADAGSDFVVSDRPPGEQAGAVLRRGRKRYYSGSVALLVGLVVVAGAWLLF